MSSALDEYLATLGALPEQVRAEVEADAIRATAGMAWIPNPGPQTEAYFSPADVLLYGGQGGGGKSSLILGLSLTQHRRSLLMRRQYSDLNALTEEAIRFNGTRDGFNGSPPPKLRTRDTRLIEFGGAKSIGDEQHWQGQAHDLLGFDEAVQFAEAQVRFLMGWVRTTEEGQRCRTVMATNPPVTAEGQWIVGMFRPWLDVTHPSPAKPGELRWFVTDPDGKDVEVGGPEPIEMGGKVLLPKSRTFIPAALGDNPFLVNSGYQATLDALPEPLRSAVRDGNFMAARRDGVNQIIPASWVLAAQGRWTPNPPRGVPMCALAVDVAQGGADDTVLAPRYDGYYPELTAVPGKQTPFGKDVAGLVITHRRGNPMTIIDMGGGYGGAAFEHLRDNNIPVQGYKGAAKATGRTKDKQLRFFNMRSQAYWRFREALDPSQEGGSPIALPPDPILLADLTAVTFEIGPNGIKAEPKEDVCDRLGRSTDRGDAVVMAWTGGDKIQHQRGGWGGQGDPSGEMGTASRNHRPQVVMSHASARGVLGR